MNFSRVPSHGRRLIGASTSVLSICELGTDAQESKHGRKSTFDPAHE